MPATQYPVVTAGQQLTAGFLQQFAPFTAWKTASLTRSTLTLAIDPDLQVSLAANAWYEVDAAIGYTAASGGLSFTWSLPSGAAGDYLGMFSVSGTTAANLYGWGGTQTAATSGGNQGILVSGMLSTSGAGTFGFSWASATGPASLTISQYSKLRVRRAA